LRNPEREAITYRYLKHAPSLARQALEQLAQEDQPAPVESEETGRNGEETFERRISLNEERLGAVLAALRASAARKVVDLGYGEGHLIRELMKDK
jgi:hypothetical protein